MEQEKEVSTTALVELIPTNKIAPSQLPPKGTGY